MFKLYDNRLSRNGYKMRLAMSHLDMPFEVVEVDITKGESRTPEFLTKNPGGRVPVLELEDGSFLPESNAGLCYIADGTDLFPSDRKDRAHVLRWMFFEQNNVEPNVGSAKLWRRLGWDKDRPEEFAAKVKGALDALQTLERHLSGNDWLAVGRFTVADIAVYAYLHEAGAAGIDLAAFPSVGAWLARVAALPKHVPQDWGFVTPTTGPASVSA